MSDSQKFRDRKFVMVLYPEDAAHSAAMEKMKSGGYNFAAILHDKDKTEDGSSKKPHWHVVVRFKNACWNTAIAKELGIAPNYLEACKDVDGALLYLVHFGNEEKFQYDYEAVFGPLRIRLATLLAEPDEGARVLTLVDIVRDSPGLISYSELIIKSVRAGVYSDLRRMGSIGVALVREHNDNVYKELVDPAESEDTKRFRDFEEFTSNKTDNILPL